METRVNPLPGIVSQDRHPGLPGATASRDTACLLRAPSRGASRGTGPRKSTEAASRERRVSRTRRAGLCGRIPDRSVQAARTSASGNGCGDGRVDGSGLASPAQPEVRRKGGHPPVAASPPSGRLANERRGGSRVRRSSSHHRSVAGRGFPSDAERRAQVPPLGRLRLYRGPGAVVTGARVQPPPGISVSIRS